MVEKKLDMQALSFQWGVLGGNAAVAAGAFAALVSLMRGVSLSSACVRGLACVLLLRVVFYLIRAGIEFFDQKASSAEEVSPKGQRTLPTEAD